MEAFKLLQNNQGNLLSDLNIQIENLKTHIHN